MKSKAVLLSFSCLLSASAIAQEVTPIWVQHINGAVNVDAANRIPILVKPTGAVLAAPDGNYRDGREPLSAFARLIPFNAQRLLLAIMENGIDEQDASLPQAQKNVAAQFPDRSLVWLDAATAKPLGVAWKESLRPADQINYDVTAADKGYQSSKLYQLWRPALDENPDPAKRAIYSGYKHLILRYAPKADGSGWETTPTIAWEEPVPGLADDGSVSPEAGIGDGLSGTTGTSGEGGSWRSFRWRNIRVTGFGNTTVIYAGGGTWRIGSHPQAFSTTDGLTFRPIARVNDRDGARRNAFSLGGCSSRIVTPGTDATRPNLQVVYHGHYPGTGWQARPNRYTSDPDKPSPSPEYNQQPGVRLFNQDEAASGGFPAFVWQAAGKDGLPIDNAVDGVTRYDGNWNMSLETHPALDYIVAYSSASLDVGYYTYGWLGIHRLDGSIASGNSSYKLPFREDDAEIDYANLGGGPEPDFDTTEGWVDVVPDTTAPANQGKSTAYVAFSNGGFGVFAVQNVAASITQQPVDITVQAGSSTNLSAAAAGSPNSYRWKKDGVPLSDGRYVTGTRTTSLQFSQVVKADAGLYEMEITNPLSGVTTTHAARVTVTGAYVRSNPNAAILGVASQVSTDSGGLASRANDGNTNGAWGAGSVAHTAGSKDVLWWEVDLGSDLDIGRVTYWARTDCCIDRSQDVTVLILDANRAEKGRQVTTIEDLASPSSALDFSPSVKGRFVRIERQTADPAVDTFLNIAEVEVFNKFRPTMDIGIQNGKAVIAWNADAFSTPTLQQSDTLGGTFSNVAGATSPHTVDIGTAKFYRLVQ